MPLAQIEVEDSEAAIELFHAKGWTDGLPIIPPTEARVERFLAAAARPAEEQIGFYEERRMPVTIGKLAINAVMAGCLPEHFPVVIAIVEAMMAPGMPLHVANSSTGSFTYGFIVNGPIRKALGMNWQGNVLGPGNRANSSIGRAIRLIQLNVLGSIPGAGDDHPTHGRVVLDRSMMGQPAKYATYHMVENEEDFPELLPIHVELGYKPEDSTVTVMVLGGYTWMDGHGEQTPEDWIEGFAHYVVASGRLVGRGNAVVLMPPENARLFVNAGWSKADIREALYQATRRSVAWVKSNGYRVSLQRLRNEPIRPEDEERFMAISGSSAPEDLHIVVCGGPAGGWPFFLHGLGGRAVTRTIGG
jgi:hypothetical protein